MLMMQVAESLKRFGISDETANVLVARFDAGPEEVGAATVAMPSTQAHRHLGFAPSPGADRRR
jgi:hypothetical protein